MYEKQIEAGCTWLNEHYGNEWYKEIDLDALEMRDRYRCIIGQLAGNYDNVFSYAENYVGCLPVRLGLTCSQHDINNTWQYKYTEPDHYCFSILTSEWKQTVSALRG